MPARCFPKSGLSLEDIRDALIDAADWDFVVSQAR